MSKNKSARTPKWKETYDSMNLAAENTAEEPVFVDNSRQINLEKGPANTQYILNHGSNLTQIAAEIQKTGNYGSKKIIKMLEETALIRSSVLELAENILPEQDFERFQEAQKSLKEVVVSAPQNPQIHLKIELYPLVPFPYKGAYNVYFEVLEAVKSFLSTHPEVQISHQKRYTLVYKRITQGDLTLGSGRCDNDNFEMKRVTNAISDAIGIADSVDKLSFFYTTFSGEKSKTIIYLMDEIQPDFD